MSQSGSESDIWEYKPLKKSKRQDAHKTPKDDDKLGTKSRKVAKRGQSETSVKVKKTPNKTTTKASHRNSHTTTTNSQYRDESVQISEVGGTHSTRTGPSVTVTPEDAGRTPAGAVAETSSLTGGYCPICQMPFSILKVQSRRWHVTECLDIPGEDSKECPDGLQCSSSIPSHYKRVSHSLLARSRAIDDSSGPRDLSQEGGASAAASFGLPQRSSDGKPCSSSMDSAVNLSSASSLSASPSQGPGVAPTPTRSNALLLLRSPAPEDVRKKKGWSSAVKVSRSQTSGAPLEANTRTSTPVKPDCADEVVQTGVVCFSHSSDDDEISYSPLSEFPAGTGMQETQSRKKLFQSSALEQEQEDDNASLMLFDNAGSSDDGLFSDVLDPCETKRAGSREGGAVVKGSSDTCAASESSLAAQSHVIGASSTAVLDGPRQHRSREQHTVADCDDTSAGPQLWSPQSLVLERLREQISNPGSVNGLHPNGGEDHSTNVNREVPSTQTPQPSTATQTPQTSMAPRQTQAKARPSGLKQTDIGVFFGLKPLEEKETGMAPAREKVQRACAGAGQSAGARGEDSRRPSRRRGKASASDASTVLVSADDGNNQPTQTEGVMGGGRAGGEWRGRGRWNRGRGTDGGAETKRCPFYKKIPGTGFAVDAFQYGAVEGVTVYFLTHFHSDHYGGLKKSSTLPIYCNKITGNLVKSKLKVDEQYVHVLPMNTEVTVEGVKVILLDANHCPGSAMLLFLLPDGQTVLHTGDFRADPSMERYPELLGRTVQTLYLDTTYCSPEYTFPTQQEVITFAANVAFELVTLNPRMLVVCGTYSVGKEKVFLAVSEVLGSKVCLTRDKFNTMCCLECDLIRQRITTDLKAAQVHVLPMMQLNFKSLQAHLSKCSGKYDQVVAFKPTGWTFSQTGGGVEDIQPQIQGNILIYGVPYSEHSSYLEMKRFVQWLRPAKIVPTVNVGSWSSRKAMERCFSQWDAEVRALSRRPAAPTNSTGKGE